MSPKRHHREARHHGAVVDWQRRTVSGRSTRNDNICRLPGVGRDERFDGEQEALPHSPREDVDGEIPCSRFADQKARTQGVPLFPREASADLNEPGVHSRSECDSSRGLKGHLQKRFLTPQRRPS